MIASAMIVALTVCILLAGAKGEKPELSENDFMLPDNMLPIRGAMAMVVLLHHFSGFYKPAYFLMPFQHVGYLLVAMFFFLSGYGVCAGFLRRSGYLQSFWKKRFISLYLPYLVSILIYGAVDSFVYQKGTFFARIIPSLVGIHSISPLGWYVGALMLMYAVFYASAMQKDQRMRKLVFMALYGLVYMGLWLLPIDKVWTRSLIGFPIGLVYCSRRAEISRYYQAKRIPFLGLAIVCLLTGMGAKLYGEIQGVSLIKLIGNIVSCAAFVVLACDCLSRVRVSNAVLRIMGGLSLEIYLYHRMVLDFLGQFHSIRKNMLVFYLGTLVGTVAVSWLIHSASKLVFGIGRNRYGKTVV